MLYLFWADRPGQPAQQCRRCDRATFCDRVPCSLELELLNLIIQHHPTAHQVVCKRGHRFYPKPSWCQKPYTRFQKPSLHEASWNDPPKIRIVFSIPLCPEPILKVSKQFELKVKVWKGNSSVKMGNISEIQCIWLGQKPSIAARNSLSSGGAPPNFTDLYSLQTDHSGPIRSHVGDRLSRCLMLDDDGVWRCMDLYELIEPKNSWFCGWGMMVHPLNLASHLLGKFVLLFRSAQWALTNLAPQRTHSRCIKSISQALNQLWIKTTSHLNQTDQSSALSFPLFPWQRPVILVPCMGISKKMLVLFICLPHWDTPA